MTASRTALARKQLLRRGRTLLRSGARKGTPDVLEALSPAERDELTEIHRALERIERGIFGKCETCSERIEDERIESEPWRALCGSCDDARVETVASAADVAAHAE